MNLLLDANIILDKALRRPRHVEVDQLFNTVTGDQLSISRFSLHAVCWYMAPRNRDGLRWLIMDLSLAGVSVVDLSLDELSRVVDAMEQFAIDFDDAFNVAVAAKLDLTPRQLRHRLRPHTARPKDAGAGAGRDKLDVMHFADPF